MNGYVKPLFRNLQVFSLTEDIKDGNPLKFFWQALIGGITTALKNQPRDQFGTRIPFSADATGTKPDLLATIGNVLRNAFMRAYLPHVEGQQTAEDGIEFGPADFGEHLSTGGVF
jgi:hypothetical protein